MFLSTFGATRQPVVKMQAPEFPAPAPCQLHPEKQGYHWPDRKDIFHHKYPIELSHYLAQSFIRECLKCKN